MAKITEQQIATDVELRKKLIEGWDKDTQRKDEAFKAYECLKDRTVNYVFDLLMRQFDFETVAEMQYAMSNVSILRKVIDKLAKVYANGVKRTMPDPEGAKPLPELPAPPAPPALPDPNADPNAPPAAPVVPELPKPKVLTQAEKDTKLVEDASEFFDMNAVMKKTNRYFRTFWNTLVYVKPMPVEDKFTIALEVKPPFSYDVVPDPDNHALPLAIVCSDYIPRRRSLYALGDAATAGRTIGVVRDVKAPEVTQLALTPSGQDDTRQFVWWTKSYHFTTNVKGEILPEYSSDGDVNPIAILPFVNFAGEQDLGFFAEGGSDLVDAGIKINTFVSNVQHIAIIQGYGQLFMSGKNLPQVVKVGPTHCIKLPQEEGDPEPKIGFLTANPPLTELQALVEMAVALMLSTNNLSTSGFSTSLKGGSKDMASGVALMIDKSESIEDVNEQSLIFIKKEPEVWVRIQKWLEVYKTQGTLIEELMSMELPADMGELQLKFPSPKPIISESDELDILKKRQDLGLNTEAEILMRDDPSLSEEDARAKIIVIEAERAANRAKFGFATDADESLGGPQAQGGVNGNQGQSGGGQQGKNGNPIGANKGAQGFAGKSKGPNQK